MFSLEYQRPPWILLPKLEPVSQVNAPHSKICLVAHAANGVSSYTPIWIIWLPYFIKHSEEKRAPFCPSYFSPINPVGN